MSLNSFVNNEEGNNINENDKNINIDEIQNDRKNTGDYNGTGKENKEGDDDAIEITNDI